jgi:hypothetical protein
MLQVRLLRIWLLVGANGVGDSRLILVVLTPSTTSKATPKGILGEESVNCGPVIRY